MKNLLIFFDYNITLIKHIDLSINLQSPVSYLTMKRRFSIAGTNPKKSPIIQWTL